MKLHKLIWAMFAMVLALTSLVARAADFLDPAEAFRLTTERVGDALTLRWSMAKGYHLYADRFEAKASHPSVRLGDLKKPQGQEKFDPNFGKIMTQYEGEVSMTLPVTQWPSSGESFEITVTSQGCAEAGLCYPPQEVLVKVEGKAVAVNANVAPQSDEEKISSTLQSGSVWKIALMFFGLGLLLSFTPCVLPMIPILSSIIVGAGGPSPEAASRGRGFALSLAYSLGMILVYTSMGVVAGLLGEGLAASLQKPWVIGVFSALLFGFGLAMFDVFTLEMPSGLQNRLTSLTNRIPGGKFTGVFAMGGLSALIVGPCIAAPLAGTLVYIGKSGNVLIGGIALFCLSLGMSQPLLLTGLSAGKLLPRAGAWMNGVKRLFGLLLFATALWLANPILPQVAFIVLVAILLLMSALWLSAFAALPVESGLAKTAGKAIGLLLAGMAVLQLIGLASGGRDALQPLKHFAQARAATVTSSSAVSQQAPSDRLVGLQFSNISNARQLDTLLVQSKKPVVLDVYADWCTSCKEMEHGTFTDPRVIDLMSKATLVRIDVTKNSSEDKALMKRYQLFGPPALLVLKPDGEEISKGRVIGYKAAEPFLAQLQPVLDLSAK
jgi:thioredoxin:protein disulfide reductase